ncbi:MAG: GtrA family protein [Saccharofermentans sp.]|nr:GtrA family protein [Saccharofermentans sp.]
MTIKEVFFGGGSLTPKQEEIRQLVMYPFAGVFTAFANFTSFVVMDLLLTKAFDVAVLGYSFDLTILLKQLVSWIATILTAYTSNRIFVFRSHGNYWLELLGFALARLSTFVFVELALFAGMVMFLENSLGIDNTRVIFVIGHFNVTYLYLVKLVNNIVLVILNFVLSKWLVFRSSLPKTSSQRSGSDGR